jgi:hypothetical protein
MVTDPNPNPNVVVEPSLERPPARRGKRVYKRAITDEHMRGICEQVMLGLPIDNAAWIVGLSPATVWKELAHNEAFQQAVRAAEGKLKRGLLSIIVKQAQNGQWTAAARVLERRWPHEFAKIERTELSEPGGIPLPPDRSAYIVAVREALGWSPTGARAGVLPAPAEEEKPRRKKISKTPLPERSQGSPTADQPGNSLA